MQLVRVDMALASSLSVAPWWSQARTQPNPELLRKIERMKLQAVARGERPQTGGMLPLKGRRGVHQGRRHSLSSVEGDADALFTHM